MGVRKRDTGLMNQTIASSKPARIFLIELAAILLSAATLLAGGDGRVEKTFDTTREPRISLTNL